MERSVGEVEIVDLTHLPQLKRRSLTDKYAVVGVLHPGNPKLERTLADLQVEMRSVCSFPRSPIPPSADKSSIRIRYVFPVQISKLGLQALEESDPRRRLAGPLSPPLVTPNLEGAFSPLPESAKLAHQTISGEQTTIFFVKSE